MNFGKAIIIDNGSHTVKSGFGGDDAPLSVIKSIIGHQTEKSSTKFKLNTKEPIIGDNVEKDFSLLNISYPFEYGVTTNWDAAEQLWLHVFQKELNVIPEEYNVLLTENLCCPKNQREKTVEIMFEKFKFRGTYLAIQSVLALYSYGKTTGLDVSLGEGVVFTVPIYEGYALPHAILKANIGGKCLTNFMYDSLAKQYYPLERIAKRSDLEKVKENCCYVAGDYEEEKEKLLKDSSKVEMKYSLPDGQYITIKEERFKCPEILFNPNIAGHECFGIHQMAFNSAMKCGIDVHNHGDIFRNISLSGGSSLFSGLPERFLKELKSLVSVGTKVNVDPLPEKRYSSWIGGSVLASCSSFNTMWFKKDEYEEFGASYVHRKCF